MSLTSNHRDRHRSGRRGVECRDRQVFMRCSRWVRPTAPLRRHPLRWFEKTAVSTARPEYAGADRGLPDAVIDPIMPAAKPRGVREKHDTDFAYEVPNLARFRANVFADRKGRARFVRVIPSEILTAEKIGLSQHSEPLPAEQGARAGDRPTGSGKSTTLCAMIRLHHRTRDEHIITIRRPD